jgi:hypothetical protein
MVRANYSHETVTLGLLLCQQIYGFVLRNPLPYLPTPHPTAAYNHSALAHRFSSQYHQSESNGLQSQKRPCYRGL